jgi:hypothetical protein
MPKRIQLPDDFYKHDFKQLAKIEKHPLKSSIALISWQSVMAFNNAEPRRL